MILFFEHLLFSTRTDWGFDFPVAGGVNMLIKLCEESGLLVVPRKWVNLVIGN